MAPTLPPGAPSRRDRLRVSSCRRGPNRARGVRKADRVQEEGRDIVMRGLCTASKRDGTPCRAFAMTESHLCAGRAGKGLAANPVAAAHQSAINRQTQAEVRKKRAIDVYRDAVEELAQSFVDARLSIINDPRAPSGDRLRAMEQLESRALGRPKETVEHLGEENPLRDERIPQEERRAWLRRLNGVEPSLDELAE